MARVTHVKSARGRKDGRPMYCSGCRKEIKPGDPYKWFANRIGRSSSRKNYCDTCRIRPSAMTTSPNLSALYAAQEAAEDAGGSATGELADAQIVRDYAESVREVQGMYEESAQNMEDGFGHETYQSEEIREKASACESFADELDSQADEIENMDDPDEDEDHLCGEYEGETNEDGEPVDAEEFAEFLAAKRDERRDAVLDAIDAAISDGPEL